LIGTENKCEWSTDPRALFTAGVQRRKTNKGLGIDISATRLDDQELRKATLPPDPTPPSPKPTKQVNDGPFIVRTKISPIM